MNISVPEGKETIWPRIKATENEPYEAYSARETSRFCIWADDLKKKMNIQERQVTDGLHE